MNHFKFSRTRLLASGLLLLQLLASSLALANTRGPALRAFLSDLVTASGQTQEAQPEAMREAFARHPKVLEWLSQEKDPAKLLREADLDGLGASALNEKEIAAKLHQYAQLRVEKIAGRPEFQHGVAAQVLKQVESAEPATLPDELRKDPKLQAFARDKGKFAARYYAHLPESQRVELLRTIDDDSFRELGTEINRSISEAKLSETKAIQSLTSGDAFNMGNAVMSSDEMGEYIERYFDNLPLQDRRPMLVGYLKLPPGASNEKQLGAILQNTGPGMQKLFQLIGKDAKSEVLRGVLAELKENIEAFPFDEVKKVIEADTGKPLAETFKWIDEKHLAAATVGQVHRATLHDGTQVAVKIRRPGIIEEVDREMVLTRKVAEGSGAEKMVDQLENNLERELDFRIEGRSVDMGEAVYTDEKLGLAVASRVKEAPNTDRMIVTRLAEGKTMTKLDKAGKAWLNKALAALFDRWFDNALFGNGHYATGFSGFFHGDLHSGNRFLTRVTQTKDPVTGKKKPNYKLTLIDFGNAGTLTVEQRRTFAQLTIAALANAPEEMVRALGNISELTPETQKKIVVELKKLDLAKMNFSDRIAAALAESLAGGLIIPDEFLSFKRGMEFLESEIEHLNQSLDRIDRKKKLPRVDTGRIMAQVAARRLSFEIPGQLFSSKIRQNTVVPLGSTTATFLRVANEKTAAYFATLRGCLGRALGSLPNSNP